MLEVQTQEQCRKLISVWGTIQSELQYTVYSVWSTVYNVWSTVYSVWSTVYSVWSTVYSVWSISRPDRARVHMTNHSVYTLQGKHTFIWQVTFLCMSCFFYIFKYDYSLLEKAYKYGCSRFAVYLTESGCSSINIIFPLAGSWVNSSNIRKQKYNPVTSTAAPVSCSGDTTPPPWSLKLCGLESSGWTLISSSVKTKRIAFNLILFGKMKNISKSFSYFLSDLF